MMKRMMIILGLLFWMNGTFGQQPKEREKVYVAGIVCDLDSVWSLPDAIYRRNGVTYGLDKQGRFSFEANVGDTLYFSHVGYVPVKLIINDTLVQKDYLLGIFMTRDTILLSEVVILPRYLLDDYKPDQNYVNAMHNGKGALAGAFAPIVRMDKEMNQKMQIEKFAFEVENKGHVKVGFGVGSQSISALRKLRVYRKLSDRHQVIQSHEIDLLKKFFYLEKREKLAN